jgi:hypothetical protein
MPQESLQSEFDKNPCLLAFTDRTWKKPDKPIQITLTEDAEKLCRQFLIADGGIVDIIPALKKVDSIMIKTLKEQIDEFVETKYADRLYGHEQTLDVDLDELKQDIYNFIHNYIEDDSSGIE